nr:hypothetical protein [uncultured Rhodopila sp.]
MAMKRRNLSTFVLFDVTYTDGTRTSNRKVLESLLNGPDGDDVARDVLEAQDREIAASSGCPGRVIKSVTRVRV